MKIKPMVVKSTNQKATISNVCVNCQKEFKKVLNHYSVIYCSAECAQEYERKKT